MQSLSINQKAIIEADKKGYTVNKKGIVASPNGTILSCSKGSNGYLKFGIKVPFVDYSCSVTVHSFMAYKKYGKRYLKKEMEARHLDGDIENNTWDNIVIGTHSDNMMDIPKEVRLKKAHHASSFCGKHDHKAIKECYNKGNVTYKDIMKEFGISSKGTVSYIINK